MLWGRPGIPCSSRVGLRHTSGCAVCTVCTGTTGPGPLHLGAEEPPAPAGRSRGGLLAGTSGVGCDHLGGGRKCCCHKAAVSVPVCAQPPAPTRPRAHLPGRTDRCQGRRCLPARPRCSSRCPCLALLRGPPRPRVPLARLLPRVASPPPRLRRSSSFRTPGWGEAGLSARPGGPGLLAVHAAKKTGSPRADLWGVFADLTEVRGSTLGLQPG